MLPRDDLHHDTVVVPFLNAFHCVDDSPAVIGRVEAVIPPSLASPATCTHTQGLPVGMLDAPSMAWTQTVWWCADVRFLLSVLWPLL